ncbi:MAG TPA: DegV family protein [Anaerolineales bacterium]|nr:DegV family protein [Anaerolineales bacterium]
MPGVTILTDSTAQFITEDFVGCNAVSVIPLHVQVSGAIRRDRGKIDILDLPVSIRRGAAPVMRPPSPEEFHNRYVSLNREADEIITLLHSGQLSPAVRNAEQAAQGMRGRMDLPVVDSQTTGVGLGLIVQTAAAAALQGIPPAQILEQIRLKSQKIYSIFCLQSLSYLAAGGHLDPIQALVGEMLGITPLVLLENGGLVTIQKARSPRHLADLLVEFVAEFEDLQHLALIRGRLTYEISSLRERIQAYFPGVPFTEHTLGAGLGAILGPRSLNLVAMEDH